MAKEDYGQLAKEAVAAVGRKENIVSVSNCMTRLRFVLKDDTIPNKDEVSKIKGVKGVMNQGGQYQVIIGNHVSEVVKFVKTEAGITGNSKAVNKEDYQVMKKDSLWNRFFKVISGCIMPMIGPMIAGGILKRESLSFLQQWVSSQTQMEHTLYFMQHLMQLCTLCRLS